MQCLRSQLAKKKPRCPKCKKRMINMHLSFSGSPCEVLRRSEQVITDGMHRGKYIQQQKGIVYDSRGSSNRSPKSSAPGNKSDGQRRLYFKAGSSNFEDSPKWSPHHKINKEWSGSSTSFTSIWSTGDSATRARKSKVANYLSSSESLG